MVYDENVAIFFKDLTKPPLILKISGALIFLCLVSGQIWWTMPFPGIYTLSWQDISVKDEKHPRADRNTQHVFDEQHTRAGRNIQPMTKVFLIHISVTL